MFTRVTPRRGAAPVVAVLTFTLAALAATSATARPTLDATGTTISGAQFAKRADRICARDARQQAALGPGVVNADLVTSDHLPKAAAYLDKIVAITNTEVRRLAALPRTKTGMRQRNAVVAAIREIRTDEREASAAAHNGDLAGFQAAFNKFILHGRPTGPDYRKAIRASKAAAKIFPFKVCGKTSAVYP